MGFDPGTNRLRAAQYDRAGNQTQVGSIGLRYDAENRQLTSFDSTSQAGVTYIYDGQGQRVAKLYGDGSRRVVYVYDALGQLAAEYTTDAANAPVCQTCYLTYDHLGSVRVVTDQNAQIVSLHDYVPFGEEIPNGWAGRSGLFGTSEGISQRFTGQERDVDTVPSLDFFQARYFSGEQGRFASPDPANAGADPTNPQSWNGYSYVWNNPLNSVDPSGMIAEANPPPVTDDGDDGGGLDLGFFFNSWFGFGGGGGGPSLHVTPQQPVRAQQPPAKTGIGIRNPGQSFRACMQQHANDYNIGGSVELLADLTFNDGIGTSYSSSPILSFFTGDAITSLAFGSTSDASSVAANAAPGVVRAGMGAVTTYGRRTSTIMSLNFPPPGGRAPGGLPRALGQSGEAAFLRGTLSRIGSAFSLGLKASTRWALDAAFAGAEMVDCSTAY